MAVPSAGACEDVERLALHHLPRGEQRCGVEVALDRASVRPADPLPRGVERDPVVDADRVAAGARHRREQFAGPHAEVDHRHVEVGEPVEQPPHVRATRGARTRQARALRPRSRRPAAPARPRPTCARRCGRTIATSDDISASHDRGFAEHQGLRPRVVARRPALDQVGRQRERRAGEPDQRHVELGAQRAGSSPGRAGTSVSARADGAARRRPGGARARRSPGPGPARPATGRPRPRAGPRCR